MSGYNQKMYFLRPIAITKINSAKFNLAHPLLTMM